MKKKEERKKLAGNVGVGGQVWEEGGELLFDGGAKESVSPVASRANKYNKCIGAVITFVISQGEGRGVCERRNRGAKKKDLFGGSL